MFRQAEQLKERQAKGETLLPEQSEKVASIPSLEEQLASLSLTTSTSSPALNSVIDEATNGDFHNLNTARVPGLPVAPVDVSHPLAHHTDEMDHSSRPDEAEAHQRTKESGKPSTVPSTAA